MGRGQRVRNEFVESERKQEERRQRDIPATRPTWSELSVARMADIDPNYLTHDWADALNDIGHRNRRYGAALALGSVAITLVPSTQMSKMLAHRYPSAYSEPRAAKRVQQKIRDGIQDFIRTSQQDAFSTHTRRIETVHYMTQNGLLVSNELSDEQDVPVSEPEQVPFAAGQFTVSDVKLYGRGFGINLEHHENFYRERENLLAHLKHNEKLDTRELETDGWVPHATVFRFRDDVKSAGLDRQEDLLPPTIWFEGVKTDVS